MSLCWIERRSVWYEEMLWVFSLWFVCHFLRIEIQYLLTFNIDGTYIWSIISKHFFHPSISCIKYELSTRFIILYMEKCASLSAFYTSFASDKDLPAPTHCRCLMFLCCCWLRPVCLLLTGSVCWFLTWRAGSFREWKRCIQKDASMQKVEETELSDGKLRRQLGPFLRRKKIPWSKTFS